MGFFTRRHIFTELTKKEPDGTTINMDDEDTNQPNNQDNTNNEPVPAQPNNDDENNQDDPDDNIDDNPANDYTTDPDEEPDSTEQNTDGENNADDNTDEDLSNDYTNDPDEDNVDDTDGTEPNDYTNDPDDTGDDGGEGADDDTETDYTQDDGEETDDGNTDNGNEDTTGDATASSGENPLKDLENDLFKDLTPDQLNIKNMELKQQYIEIYGTVTSALVRLEKANRNEENLKPINFVEKKLNELKDLIAFYLKETYDTKSYIENNVMYQEYLVVLNSLIEILTQIKIKIDK